MTINVNRIIYRITFRKFQLLLFQKEHMPVRGTLSKGKVHCACRMCRYEQYHAIPKVKYKEQWKAMQQT